MAFKGLDFGSGIERYADLLAASYKDQYQREQDAIKNEMLQWQNSAQYGAPLPEGSPYEGPVFFAPPIPGIAPAISTDVAEPAISMMDMGGGGRAPAVDEAAILERDLKRGRVGGGPGVGVPVDNKALREDVERAALLEAQRKIQRGGQPAAPVSQVDQMFKDMVTANPEIVKRYGPYLNRMYLELKEREISAQRPTIDASLLNALVRPPAQPRPAAKPKDPRVEALDKDIRGLERQLGNLTKPMNQVLDLQSADKIKELQDQISALREQRNSFLGIKEKRYRLPDGSLLTEKEIKTSNPKAYDQYKKKGMFK